MNLSSQRGTPWPPVLALSRIAIFYSPIQERAGVRQRECGVGGVRVDGCEASPAALTRSLLQSTLSLPRQPFSAAARATLDDVLYVSKWNETAFTVGGAQIRSPRDGFRPEGRPKAPGDVGGRRTPSPNIALSRAQAFARPR